MSISISSLISELRECEPEMIGIRRDLHRHPELAFREVRTAEVIRSLLSGWGIELIDTPNVPTAVTGIIRGEQPGPTVLLRNDTDALPMQETTGLPFASETDGCSHACGHDIHTAVLLMTAKVMQKHTQQLKGNILLAFQPAEENASGGKAMLANGFGTGATAYEEVLSVHTLPGLTAGEIGMAKGMANASFDTIHITVTSCGGHGAYPYRCADPVAAAAYLITQLQTVISRDNPALKPAVLTFGSIHGGTAVNIIPTSVEIGGTLRAFDEENRHNLWEAIRRVSEHCCAAMRAGCEVEIIEGIPPLINDPALCDAAAAAADRILGGGHVHWIDATPGSDDFSVFEVGHKGVQFRIGTGNDRPESRLGIHHPCNIFDEGAIYTGAAIFCAYLAERLG